MLAAALEQLGYATLSRIGSLASTIGPLVDEYHYHFSLISASHQHQLLSNKASMPSFPGHLVCFFPSQGTLRYSADVSS